LVWLWIVSNVYPKEMHNKWSCNPMLTTPFNK
jgi:hypothetical protein